MARNSCVTLQIIQQVSFVALQEKGPKEVVTVISAAIAKKTVT